MEYESMAGDECGDETGNWYHQSDVIQQSLFSHRYRETVKLREYQLTTCISLFINLHK